MPSRSKPQNNGHVDRLPPHSPECEQGVLGSILLDPQQVLPLCIEKISRDAFYDLRHQTIYDTMIELWEDNAPVTDISLYERLQVWGKADECGGVAYLMQLPNAVPSAANAAYYLETVRDRWIERRMIRVCTENVGRLYEHEGSTAELMDQVERDILHVAESRSLNTTPTTTELVRDAIRNIEHSWQHAGELVGIASGFTDLDRMTGGFRGGNMIVVAARPSMGKTSLAMNIADHVAVTLHIPVGVFSLEMTGVELVERMIASRARVNLRTIRDGFLAERDVPKLTHASGQIAAAPLYIDDSSGLSILQVRAKARRWHQQHHVRLIIIDYLQLMNASGGRRKFESRQQEVSDISCGVKCLAKELNVPVLVLSQLNRDIERDKSRKPKLSDLRESGSIEQDADLVGFLYEGKEDDEDDGGASDDAKPINLLIAKQRNGPKGDVHLTFLAPYTRFESAARVSEDDVPEHQPQQSLPYNDS